MIYLLFIRKIIMIISSFDLFLIFYCQPVSGCECLCDDGYSGSLCENLIPTEEGDPCVDETICTEVGQICEESICVCDLSNGFIKDDFIPSSSYGECVGPVPVCDIDLDCELFQTCTEGFCACIDDVGDMCLKERLTISFGFNVISLRGSVHFGRFALFQFFFSSWETFCHLILFEKKVFQTLVATFELTLSNLFFSDRLCLLYKLSLK
jgi:hypothetical protein